MEAKIAGEVAGKDVKINLGEGVGLNMSHRVVK
jgi:hypothetical protein